MAVAIKGSAEEGKTIQGRKINEFSTTEISSTCLQYRRMERERNDIRNINVACIIAWLPIFRRALSICLESDPNDIVNETN